MRRGTHKVLWMGVVLGRVWGAKASGMVLSQRRVCAAEKEAIGVFVFVSGKVEHELACTATIFWAQAVWTEQSEKDMEDTRGEDRSGKLRHGGKEEDFQERSFAKCRT